jgi:hypothetical protein
MVEQLTSLIDGVSNREIPSVFHVPAGQQKNSGTGNPNLGSGIETALSSPYAFDFAKL